MVVPRENDPGYILNPRTGRYVLRDGAVGKRVLSEGVATDPSVLNQPRPLCKKKPPDIQFVSPLLPRPTQIPPRSILALDMRGMWHVFPLAHFVAGMRKVESELSELHQANAGTIKRTCLVYSVSILMRTQRDGYATLESVRGTKLTTWTGKCSSSDIGILAMSLSQILGRVLTGVDQVSSPYWNPSFEAMSRKLWLPMLTDLPDSPLIYANASLGCVDANSWFTIKTVCQQTRPVGVDPTLTSGSSSRMSSVSCMSTLAESMGDAGDVCASPRLLHHTMKVRVYPKETIANKLRMWIAGTNNIYNKIVYFQLHCNEADRNMREYDLRELFVNEKIIVRANRMVVHGGFFMGVAVNSGCVLVDGRTGNRKLPGPIISSKPNENLAPWVARIPKAVRHGAVKDYCVGRAAAFTNMKQGNILRFRMRYRKTKKNCVYPSLHLEKNVTSAENGKYISMFPSVLKKAGIANPRILVAKGHRAFVDKYVGDKSKMQDCKLKYELGQWHLLVPYTKEVCLSENTETRGVCGIDPGVRTPLTLYDGDRIVSFGYDRSVYHRLQCKLSVLQSLRETKRISNRSYRRSRNRVRRRWVHMRDDMHYKCAAYLVDHYAAIGLPTFGTSRMVSRNGILHRKTKREMLDWGHFKFKMRVLSKARNRASVLDIDESYTTQSCTSCGTLKHVGGSKVYSCDGCGLRIDRDHGSARSIFMCTMHQRVAPTASQRR